MSTGLWGLAKEKEWCLPRQRVSSATQMEPGRERMQSISPPTFLPTPARFHHLSAVCVCVSGWVGVKYGKINWKNCGEWNDWTPAFMRIDESEHLMESIGAIITMCARHHRVQLQVNSLLVLLMESLFRSVGAFFTELPHLLCFYFHAPIPITTPL